jgi:hypothetical protein
LEHHKNLLIGLNEKLTVFNDVKQDLETHRYMLGEATDARSVLQENIELSVQQSR